MAPAPKPVDESNYSGRFAARLKSLREKAGLTVEAVTERLRGLGFPIADRSYYNWESCKSSPPLDAFPLIAQALGVKSVRTLMPEE